MSILYRLSAAHKIHKKASFCNVRTSIDFCVKRETVFSLPICGGKLLMTTDTRRLSPIKLNNRFESGSIRT